MSQHGSFTTRMLASATSLAFIALSILAIQSLAQDATPMPYQPGTDLNSLSGTIVADGSSTVGPLTEAVAEEFAFEVSDVQMEISVSGTGGGFLRFCEGETDLQNASRAIREAEIAACAEAGVEYYEFDVAYDGLAVVVNPENTWVECLTVEQLNAIWGPGSTITNWSEIDATFPDEELTLYGPGTASGTFDYFTGVINGEEGASRIDFNPSEDDNVLVEGVAGDRGAMGYFGIAYYEQNQDRLKVVPIDGGSGCIEPSAESVQDGTYVPLSRPLHVYVNAESLERPEVQEFMRYYLAEADWLAPDVGYVAAPVEVTLAEQATLEAAIAGEGTPDGPQVDG